MELGEGGLIKCIANVWNVGEGEVTVNAQRERG